MLQSMVWCNQLVTALASLLRSIAQPSTLTHISKQASRQHIMQLMQAMAQPRIMSSIGHRPLQHWPETAASTQPKLVSTATKGCKPKKIMGSAVADGQMLDVIRVSDMKHCRQRQVVLNFHQEQLGPCHNCRCIFQNDLAWSAE